MAVPRRIDIKTNPPGSSPRVSFDPDPRSAEPYDQIFWSNHDSEPHWPALLRSNGELNKTFFMPNQIAPKSQSPVFAPNAEITYTYVCSLHPDEKGTIEVTES